MEHGNRGGYNEYVVSAAYWEAHLPSLVQAVMCRDDCGTARTVHSAYLRAYGRTRYETPLVQYDTSRGFFDIS